MATVDNIVDDANKIVKLEHDLAKLTEDPKLVKILKLQQELNQQIADGWKRVEGMMVLSRTKSLKGDWGSITLVERTGFDIDAAALPPKFWKKVPDTKLIGDTYKLTNKLPKGVDTKVTTYLRKVIK